MQAYKLKGKIDSEGNLVVPQPTNLNPGEVEIIILQSDKKNDLSSRKYYFEINSLNAYFQKSDRTSSIHYNENKNQI